MERLRRNFLEHTFGTGFTFRFLEKDLAIALECGEAYKAPLPGTALAAGRIGSL
jgi:3-hydroxyisobutyrate dehydrogenase-like beta-hydroxyacid dehydrogenase